MRPYNLLLLDADDRVCRVEPLLADDEAAAVAAAETAAAAAPAAGYELWLGGARLKSRPPGSPRRSN